MLREISNTNQLSRFNQVTELIKNQIVDIFFTDEEFYKNYNFEIVNEQFYVNDDDREPNKIFLVIKFLPGEINLKQELIPFTIQAITERDGVDAAQRLLYEYTRIFDLKVFKDSDMGLVYQYYSTPNVSNNFELIYDGYRSVISTSGTILISEDLNRMSLKYYEGETCLEITDTSESNLSVKKNADLLVTPDDEQIFKWDENQNKYIEYEGIPVEVIDLSLNFDASPDTQPFFKTQNFTESTIKYGTLNFSVVSYLLKNDLNNKALRVISRRKSVNTSFLFKICFEDDTLNLPLIPYKMLTMNIGQPIAEVTTVTMAFTN